MHIAIIGGGPAGLRAAEVAANGGAAVTLFDAKPSVGRKLLVAGRGGLNITKEEGRDCFASRYSGPDQPSGIWDSLLAGFDADALRRWAAGLGIETFAASTGRVYPREMKGAPLLRRWIERLRGLGVQFAMRHRWTDITPGPRLRLSFDHAGELRTVDADAAILALGGGSWPETGSDGRWTETLQRHGIAVAPLESANCGWELDWPPEVLAKAEGLPLKNIVARAGEIEAVGELLVTRYGLEGGAIYQLGAALRGMAETTITIDFKPASRIEQLAAKMSGVRADFLTHARERWRLGDAAFAILASSPACIDAPSAAALATMVKGFAVPLLRPRPLAEAISSAGGVRWSELDSSLMLRRMPGVFVAGEMIDWEAPTGGYLMQGCFATGTRAAEAALTWLRQGCRSDTR